MFTTSGRRRGGAAIGGYRLPYNLAESSQSSYKKGHEMLRPARTVRVRTKEELAAAFATADQIVVDGDDSLLSYAVSKASNDPENNQVSVDFEPGPRELPRTGKADVALRVRAVGGISSPLLPLVLAVAVAVLAILVGAYYYYYYSAAIHI